MLSTCRRAATGKARLAASTLQSRRGPKSEVLLDFAPSSPSRWPASAGFGDGARVPTSLGPVKGAWRWGREEVKAHRQRETTRAAHTRTSARRLCSSLQRKLSGKVLPILGLPHRHRGALRAHAVRTGMAGTNSGRTGHMVGPGQRCQVRGRNGGPELVHEYFRGCCVLFFPLHCGGPGPLQGVHAVHKEMA
ncbi:unnamed protein product, partial [Discosporangium mesarthrocarpum]